MARSIVQAFIDVQHDLEPVAVEVTTGDDAAVLLQHALRRSRQAGRRQQAGAEPGRPHICVRLTTYYSAADQRLSTLHVVDLAPPCQQQQHTQQPASRSAAVLALCSAPRAASAEMSILTQLVQDLARTGTGAVGEATPSRWRHSQSRFRESPFCG